MTIILAGGSGFLGRALHRHLVEGRHTVRTLTRQQPTAPDQVQWNPDGTSGPWSATLADADAVINLSGAGIADKRWTAARKEELRTSRVLPARSIARALAEVAPRPRMVIGASGIGYYGAHGDEPVTEEAPPGSDFLARLCVDWEKEAATASSPATRVAIVRSGLVLHPAGGSLRPMLLAFRAGVGGRFASGRQFWSWIHLEDWVSLVAWLVTSTAPAAVPTRVVARQNPATAWNATAPTPVTNAEFSETLGRVLHRPALLPAPAFALRLALGEFATALTTGARVLPARALGEGFHFRFPDLDGALTHLLRPPPA